MRMIFMKVLLVKFLGIVVHFVIMRVLTLPVISGLKVFLSFSQVFNSGDLVQLAFPDIGISTW